VTTHQHTCPFCEATCGVVIETRDGAIESIRGDARDPLSRGFICPKAVALRDLHEDPDRLRRPRRRRRDSGRWEELSWDAALDLAAERIDAVRRDHGPSALGVYQGNPTVHNLGLMTHGVLTLRALSTDNRYSATSVDQLPQMLASELLYGSSIFMPVPDIDRTDYCLMLGANPAVSGGSLMTAPGMARRIEALRGRGGKLVVVDPRRTETAELADEHLSVVPGSDVLLLLAIVHVLYSAELVAPGRLQPMCDGIDLLRTAVAPFTPERVAPRVGIAAADIERIAREFGQAPSAVCYGRLGVSAQRFGGACLWLVNAINALTGNLDRAGGAMFPTPAFDPSAFPSSPFGTNRSRVRGLPSFAGEFPASVLAEEIETPGDGRLRALLTWAGNPALSCPNGRRIEAALPQLDFMVSVDFYLNETTRHADVILPPTAPLEHDHYDLAFNLLSVRDRAKYSPPLFERQDDQRHDWEILAGLLQRLELSPTQLPFRWASRVSPRRILDLGLRAGPFGLRRGLSGLSVAALEARREGIDLGPLQPRLPGLLTTPGKRIDLALPLYLADLPRVEAELLGPGDVTASTDAALPLSLIGRRQLRSNNSWLHNARSLIKGPHRCTLLVHPDDAAARGLVDGARVAVRSRVGRIEVPLQLSDEVRPGVVSLPHGWGHDRPGTELRLASERPGASLNDLTDDARVDELSGNAVLSGVPVEVEALAG